MLERLFGGGSSRDDIYERIGRRDFDGALKLIRREIDRKGPTFARRSQLADVLGLSGQAEEAARLLDQLAEETAQGGFPARAIALLKKSQRILPGRPEVEEKLAAMLHVKEDEGKSFRSSLRPPRAIEDEPPAPAPSTRTLESELSSIADEILASGGPISGSRGPGASAPGAPVVLTPLFGEFSQEELLAVIRGLTLQSFDPGDVIVSEGEPGGSLFVVTTGLVKAFVRNASGRSVKVRELGEGDFFGEISVLTGKPRSATVTAATPCELLELDRATLDAITAVHPNVRSVMEEFHRQRSDAGSAPAAPDAARP
jgi:cAMP-dependent protein kinase regulator